MLEIDLLSLFPSYIESPLQESILKRAINKGLLKVTPCDIRSYSREAHKRADDRPFGGGPGMVMMPEPISLAIRERRRSTSKVIYLSPQGLPFTSSLAKQLSQESHLILLAGHYEGIDQRVLDEEVDLEISIGDFVLTNGCLAALVLIDAVSRFVPGVLGHEEAAAQDSFEDGLLDCPHYTKPLSFHGKEVPAVLRGGSHAQINLFRKQQKIQKTYVVRPDLFAQQAPKGITLFSPDIPSLKRWYKCLFGKVESLDTLMGFSCSLGNTLLSFLPSEVVSYGQFSFSLDEAAFARLRAKVRKEFTSDLVLDEDNSFILRDPDGRLLNFLQMSI